MTKTTKQGIKHRVTKPSAAAGAAGTIAATIPMLPPSWQPYASAAAALAGIAAMFMKRATP